MNPKTQVSKFTQELQTYFPKDIVGLVMDYINPSEEAEKKKMYEVTYTIKNFELLFCINPDKDQEYPVLHPLFRKMVTNAILGKPVLTLLFDAWYYYYDNDPEFSYPDELQRQYNRAMKEHQCHSHNAESFDGNHLMIVNEQKKWDCCMCIKEEHQYVENLQG